MRKIFSIAILSAALFALSSCKKLGEEPYSVIANMSSESDMKAGMLGVYQSFFRNGWATTCSFLTMQEVGHRYSTYGSWGDAYYNDPYYDYKLNPQESSLSLNWNMLYLIINRANEIMEAAPAALADPNSANAYIGEARFLRAWAHFMLTQFWGEVPLHLESTKSLADYGAIYRSRSSIDSVYSSVVTDLEYACIYLPNKRTTADLGRATKATALGLLGKVYLTMAGKPLNKADGFQKSADTFEKLETLIAQDSVDVGLLNSYKSVFDNHNEVNKEILAAFRGSANSSSQSNGTIWSWLWVSTGMGPVTNGNFQAHMYGVRWDILRLFEKQDLRARDGVGGYYDDLSHPKINGVSDTIYFDTLALFRYRLKSNNEVVPGGGQGGGLGYSKWRSYDEWIGYAGGFQNDYIILRYGDVLLCYAEALNETGRSQEALQQLNKIRVRSGASVCPNAMYPQTDQASMRILIRQERLRELIGEGSTILDVRRWGTLQEEMSAFRQDQFNAGRAMPVYNSKYELYPIPNGEILVNPELTQNSGW